MGFVRPGSRGWKAIAQINAEKCGNWTRFVNHSCKPNCRFDAMVVGRRWRVMLVCEKGVVVGEEVCVDYGRAFWEGKKGMGGGCECGEEGCGYKG